MAKPSRRRSGDEATERVVNRAGRYTFRYPARWRVQKQGSISVVTSRDRTTKVSVSVAPRGGLLQASAQLIEEVTAVYRRVEQGAPQSDRVAGLLALLVNGTGVNSRGTRLRFLAITVAGPRRNWAIIVFTAFDTDRRRVVPQVETVVDSFRPLSGKARG